jgi:hypothetical protein
MVHLGIDIDQFILLTIYPAAAFFTIGYVAKKTSMGAAKSYLLQAVTCTWNVWCTIAVYGKETED